MVNILKKKNPFAFVKVLLLKQCEQASSVQYGGLSESGIEILSLQKSYECENFYHEIAQ